MRIRHATLLYEHVFGSCARVALPGEPERDWRPLPAPPGRGKGRQRPEEVQETKDTRKRSQLTLQASDCSSADAVLSIIANDSVSLHGCARVLR